jgi:hypothetical protein
MWREQVVAVTPTVRLVQSHDIFSANLYICRCHVTGSYRRETGCKYSTRRTQGRYRLRVRWEVLGEDRNYVSPIPDRHGIPPKLAAASIENNGLTRIDPAMAI